MAVLEIICEKPSGTIYHITQEAQEELQRYSCACGLIGKSGVIKYHQLLSKVISINGKSRFDQNRNRFLLCLDKTQIFYCFSECYSHTK